LKGKEYPFGRSFHWKEFPSEGVFSEGSIKIFNYKCQIGIFN
jgi:hypothetical protein